MFKKINLKQLIFLIIFLGLIIRLVNLSSPAFSPNDANLSYQAVNLSTPENQLPFTTYLTFIGEKIFGVNDFGARIPFILLSLTLIPLVFYLSQLFSKDRSVWINSTIITTLSPVLIFLSKTPSTAVVSVVLFTLLSFLLTRAKINIFFIIVTSLLLLLTSQYNLFTLIPFTVLVVYIFQPKISNKTKLAIFLPIILLTLITVGLFLKLQGTRSLTENYLSTFKSITISNGVNQLRGEGLDSHWPQVLDKPLFSKLHILSTGLLSWLSSLSFGTLFGEFNRSDGLSFSDSGMFPKALLLPFILAIPLLIKEKKFLLLIILPLLLTYPFFLTYPQTDNSMVLITLPFFAILIALGFTKINKFFTYSIYGVVALELILYLAFPSVEVKAYNNVRPAWVTPLISDISQYSQKSSVAVDDQIVNNIPPLINWYGYKSQPKVENISLFDNYKDAALCPGKTYIFISTQNIDKYPVTNFSPIKKYQDSFNKDRAILLQTVRCLKPND